MPEIDPPTRIDQAKSMIAEYIERRYEKPLNYETFVVSFTDIGRSWKAIMMTTLPNSGLFVVEYYTLKRRTTLRVYALTDSITKHED